VKRLALTLLVFVPGILLAKLEDVEQAQEKARNSFNENFEKFTQDKNVVGKPTKIDGTVTQGGPKTRSNKDDDGDYQSDLTMHDLSYEIEDEAQAAKNKAAIEAGQLDPADAKNRTLFIGTSEHGALSQAGGSSRLERTSYDLHDEFSKLETKKEQQEENEKKGIHFRGAYQVTTQEIIKKNNQPGGVPEGGGNPAPPPGDEEVEKVERWGYREEAKPRVDQVGSDSFQTVENAAKDEESKNDPAKMGTLVFYYEAANRAIRQLVKSTTANLAQRRIFKAIDSGSLGEKPKLSEDTPDCASWSQKALANIPPDADPATREAKEKDAQRIVEQCQQVAQISSQAINPVFETPENAPPDAKPELKQKGPDEEDPWQRDWRVGLALYGNVRKKASDVPSNWKYTDKDEKSKVTVSYDENGQPLEVREMRMSDQVDLYNDDLKGAANDLGEIQKRYDSLKMTPEQILENVKEGELSAAEITKVPGQALYEGYETPPDINKQQKNNLIPQNYEELLTKNREAQ